MTSHMACRGRAVPHALSLPPLSPPPCYHHTTHTHTPYTPAHTPAHTHCHTWRSCLLAAACALRAHRAHPPRCRVCAHGAHLPFPAHLPWHFSHARCPNARCARTTAFFLPLTCQRRASLAAHARPLPALRAAARRRTALVGRTAWTATLRTAARCASARAAGSASCYHRPHCHAFAFPSPPRALPPAHVFLLPHPTLHALFHWVPRLRCSASPHTCAGSDLPVGRMPRFISLSSLLYERTGAQ